MPTRREFIAGSVAAGTLLATGTMKAARPLNILILGGTGFTGPHQIRYAVARGHKVSMFNRGKTNPGLFPSGVEHLQGDRNGQLDALKGRKWDAVIDNPTTLPRWVRDAAAILKGNTGQYVFISTLSVYKDNSKPGMDESDATIVLDDPTVEKVTGETYGGLKALAEQETIKAYGDRATVIRPGLIIGPGDPTDRFTYWPVRIARGGEVMAPGSPLDPAQIIIDARDLAEWTIRVVEDRVFGTYNAMGPASPLTFGEMLGGIRAVLPGSHKVYFTWVPAEFLEAQKVTAWADMPVWIPPAGENAGFALRSNAKAVAKGLTFRPLADTAKATLEFHESRPAERKAKMRAGIAADREVEVLNAWKAKKA